MGYCITLGRGDNVLCCVGFVFNQSVYQNGQKITNPNLTQEYLLQSV